MTVGVARRRARSRPARARRPRSPARPRARRRRRAGRSIRHPRRSCGCRAAGSRIGKPATTSRRRRLGHAAAHEADVGAGATHVERHRIREPARRRRPPPRPARRRPVPTGAARPAASAASASGTSPPADVITSTSSASASSAGRYGRHTGRSVRRSTTVVTMRSYSRNSGETSCEHATSRPVDASACATAAFVRADSGRRAAGRPRPRRRRRDRGNRRRRTARPRHPTRRVGRSTSNRSATRHERRRPVDERGRRATAAPGARSR